MNKHKNYFIDENTGGIIGPGIFDNHKIDEKLSLKKIKSLLNNEELLIFIKDYECLLEPIHQIDVKLKWDKEFKNNICFDESGYIEDFPNEYFYFVDIWVMKNGSKIMVFSLYH